MNHGFKPAKHTKANAQGIKAVLRKSRWYEVQMLEPWRLPLKRLAVVAFCCLTAGGLSVAASKNPIVELGHPRYLLGSEAKAVAATVEEASKVILGGIDSAYAHVESRGDYIYVGWGRNDANVRDGGVSFHVDAKTFRITCREIDGKAGQRCR